MISAKFCDKAVISHKVTVRLLAHGLQRPVTDVWNYSVHYNPTTFDAVKCVYTYRCPIMSFVSKEYYFLNSTEPAFADIHRRYVLDFSCDLQKHPNFLLQDFSMQLAVESHFRRGRSLLQKFAFWWKIEPHSYLNLHFQMGFMIWVEEVFASNCHVMREILL